MRPLSSNDIEAELSYAYLHAVAARAGVGCKIGSRHDDNAGVDAELTAWGPFQDGGYLTEIDIKIQLKATITAPTTLYPGHYGYSLSGVKRYDALRELTSTPRLLVVLFLPADAADWLTLDEEGLILRRCAWWMSLRGAPQATSQTRQTLYLPTAQRFDPEGLQRLCAALSHGPSRFPTFAPPQEES